MVRTTRSGTFRSPQRARTGEMSSDSSSEAGCTHIALMADLFHMNSNGEDCLDLKKYFDRLISAVEVKQGKPAPDIYLYACDALGLRPEECIAVEDSPNGVKSAYRAGLRTIMVPDQEAPDEETRSMLFACLDKLSDFTEELLL